MSQMCGLKHGSGPLCQSVKTADRCFNRPSAPVQVTINEYVADLMAETFHFKQPTSK